MVKPLAEDTPTGVDTAGTEKKLFQAVTAISGLQFQPSTAAIITVRCTLVQSAVLLSYVVCPSVRND